MSRTKHHRTRGKPSWFDFWSKRGDMGTGAGHGPTAKHITHDRERRIEKEDLLEQIKQLEDEDLK